MFAAVWAALLSACAATPARSPRDAPPPRAHDEGVVAIEPDIPFVDLTIATLAMLDLATLLAAPKIAQRRDSMPLQAELLDALDQYIRVGKSYAATIANADAPIGPRMEPCARRLRDLVSAWTPERDVPPPIQAAAREMLAAMGIAAPPGGWDAFAGFVQPH